MSRYTFTYGLILGLILVFISTALYFFDQMANTRLASSLQILSMIILIFLGSLMYRQKQPGGIITYGESFKCGLSIGIVASVFLSIFTYCLYKFIDPGLIDKMIDLSRAKIIEKAPGATPEQIASALSYAKIFMSPLILTISAIVSSIFVSVILALITSIFVFKKEVPVAN